jgi:ABC-type multidrug transport system fused ATPase/permease subunit
MSPSVTFFRLLKYFLKYKWRIAAGLVSVGYYESADTVSAYLIARLFEILQTISQQVRLGQAIHVAVPLNLFKRLLYSFTIHGQQESFALIYKFALAVIIIILIKVVFVYVREYVMSSVQQKIMMRFRIELFDRIVVLPIKYFDENKTGYIMSRITNDVNNIEQSITLIVEMAQNLCIHSFMRQHCSIQTGS